MKILMTLTQDGSDVIQARHTAETMGERNTVAREWCMTSKKSICFWNPMRVDGQLRRELYANGYRVIAVCSKEGV